MGKDGAAGKNLDVICAIMCQLPDFLANFPGAVRFSVMQIPGKLNVGCEAGHRSCTTGDGDVSTGNIHPGADNEALRNRIAHGDIVESTIDANVANCGKPRFQHFAGIGHGLERHLRSRFL